MQYNNRQRINIKWAFKFQLECYAQKIANIYANPVLMLCLGLLIRHIINAMITMSICSKVKKQNKSQSVSLKKRERLLRKQDWSKVQNYNLYF